MVTTRLSAQWLKLSITGLLITAGAALVVTGSIGGAGSSSTAVESELSRVDHDRLSKLETQLRSLQGAVARDAIGQKSSAPLAPSPAERVAEGNDELSAPNSNEPEISSLAPPREPLEEVIRKANEARAEALQELSDKVDTEPFDDAWRVETERSIHRVIPQLLGSDVTLQEVRCASTLCRVGLSHPDQARISNERVEQFVYNRAGLETFGLSFDYGREGFTTLYIKRGVQPDPTVDTMAVAGLEPPDR